MIKTLLTFRHFKPLVRIDSLHRQRFLATATSIRMTKKALLLITEGAEEMETVITADVLRRAQVRVGGALGCCLFQFVLFLTRSK